MSTLKSIGAFMFDWLMHSLRMFFYIYLYFLLGVLLVKLFTVLGCHIIACFLYSIAICMGLHETCKQWNWKDRVLAAMDSVRVTYRRATA